jgi:hypothetical protein
MTADAKERRVRILAHLVGLGMLLALLGVFYLGHYCQLGYPHNTFLLATEDRFMDFFNVNCFSDGLNPYYTPKLSSYPPFAILVARAFAVGFEYWRLGSVAARGSVAGVLSFSLLASGFLVFYFRVIHRTVGRGPWPTGWKLALILGCNYPLLFLLDRGNYLMLAFVFLFGFVHFYRSRPGLANVCLAVAIALKIHPAIFLLLLISDRRWRDCVAVVGLTALLNLPALALFRGGYLDNLGQFLHNVLLFSGGYNSFMQDSAINLSFSNLLRVPFGLFWEDHAANLKYGKLAIALAVVIGLAWLLRSRAPYWKKIFALFITQMGLPQYSPDYNLICLVIPLLLYLEEAGAFRRSDYGVLVCVGLLFVPKTYGALSSPNLYHITPQAFLNPLLLLALFAVLVLSERAAGRDGVAHLGPWGLRRHLWLAGSGGAATGQLDDEPLHQGARR